MQEKLTDDKCQIHGRREHQVTSYSALQTGGGQLGGVAGGEISLRTGGLRAWGLGRRGREKGLELRPVPETSQHREVRMEEDTRPSGVGRTGREGHPGGWLSG